VYLTSTEHAPEPLQQSVSPPTEIDSIAPIPTLEAKPISSSQKPNASISEPRQSIEELTAAIQRTMIELMAGRRELFANGLVERGLAPVDSERLAQRFVEGFADCLLEAARKEHEAQGNLDGAEMNWTQTMAYLNLNRVQSAAVPCMANVSQQTGIPLPADFGSAGSHTDRISPEPPPPPWAADMEARIRAHIASYTELAETSVLINCVEEGCNVSLAGGDIRIFDLELDVFAAQNGFQKAVLRGDNKLRFVWLQR
jgi:hypothetical protein